MKTAIHFLYRGLFITVNLLFLTAVLNGQVKIEEKVEINPEPMKSLNTMGGNADHMINVSWTLSGSKVRMYWVREYCGSDTYIGESGTSLDFPLGAGKYMFRFWVDVSTLMCPNRVTYDIVVKVDQTVIGRYTGEACSETGYSTLYGVGDIYYNSPYYTDFSLDIGSSSDMYYEEQNRIYLNPWGSCATGTFSPATDIVQLDIIEGSQYAQFFNFKTWTSVGTSISGLINNLGNTYAIVANKSKPGPEGVFVKVKATCRLIEKTDSVRINPYYFKITANPPKVKYGEESKIFIQTVNAAGAIYNRPASPVVDVYLTGNNDYGTLRYQRGYSSEEWDCLSSIQSMYLSDPHSGLALYFKANEKQPANSKTVTFQVEKTDEGGSVNNWPNYVWPQQGADAVTGTGEVEVVKAEVLDHFKVTIVPDTAAAEDTVAFAEGATLIIQAQNKDSLDIDFDGNTLLKLSLTANEEYGTFIDVNGDTLKTTTVQLSDILYSNAKEGKIKFAAVKKNPETFVACKIRVEKKDDPAKYGERNAIVVEQTLKIVMIQPYQVQPVIPPTTVDAPRNENRKQFVAQLTRSGKPVSNHTFKLITNYINNSGGHVHITPRRTKNQDNYGHLILKRTADHLDFPYDGQTQINGKEEFEYVASLFGDIMKIRLESNKKSLLWDTLSIVEKIPGLIDFKRYRPPTEQMWTFAQLDPINMMRHPDNNWCTQNFADNLQLAIFDFYNWSLDDGTTIILSLNDMSLQLGGRFDIDALWDQSNKPQKPNQRHYYHRRGTSVDINPPLSAEQLEQLKTYMNDYDLVRNREHPQIHFGINEEY